jgi:hypothetical protein
MFASNYNWSRHPGQNDQRLLTLATHYDANKPADVQGLASDDVFLAVVDQKLAEYGTESGPIAFARFKYGTSPVPETEAFINGVRSTLATTDLANLSVDERAKIIASLAPKSYGVNRNMGSTQPIAPDVDSVKALISGLGNNQGYTGPGASAVATVVPVKNGSMTITQGQLLDDENFAALADQVFLAAGGQPSAQPDVQARMIGAPAIFNSTAGLPSSLFGDGSKNSPLAHMSEWSVAERVEFLGRVAELGKKGRLSNDDMQSLTSTIRRNDTQGGGAPAAVVDAKGKTVISKDDIMEDASLRSFFAPKDLRTFRPSSTEFSAAMARADLRKLSYDERVELVQAFIAAGADMNVSDSESKHLVALLNKDLQSDNGVASVPGKTLSNGYFVAAKDVASGASFGSTVQHTLQASGVSLTGGNMDTNNTGGAYYSYSYAVHSLVALDVSSLTASQRMTVLEKISAATADGQLTPAEARNIVADVDRLSGRPADPLRF